MGVPLALVWFSGVNESNPACDQTFGVPSRQALGIQLTFVLLKYALTFLYYLQTPAPPLKTNRRESTTYYIMPLYLINIY